MNPKTKRILVLKHPLTFIDIDWERDPIEAKQEWLAKHEDVDKFLPMQQKRRERESIRAGKIMQRTKYKFK